MNLSSWNLDARHLGRRPQSSCDNNSNTKSQARDSCVCEMDTVNSVADLAHSHIKRLVCTNRAAAAYFMHGGLHGYGSVDHPDARRDTYCWLGPPRRLASGCPDLAVL